MWELGRIDRFMPIFGKMVQRYSISGNRVKEILSILFGEELEIDV